MAKKKNYRQRDKKRQAQRNKLQQQVLEADSSLTPQDETITSMEPVLEIAPSADSKKASVFDTYKSKAVKVFSALSTKLGMKHEAKTEGDFATYLDYLDYKSKQERHTVRRKQMIASACGVAVLAAGLIATVGGIHQFTGGGKAYVITVNDREVAAVKKEKTAEEVIQTYLATQEKLASKEVFVSERLDIVRETIGDNTIMDKDQAVAALAEQVTPIISGVNIMVDGNVAVSLPDAQQAQSALQAVKDHYVPVDSTLKVIDTKFQENVTITQAYVPVKSIYNKEDAKLVLRGTDATESYHYLAQKGDTIDKIADSQGVTVNHIAIYNPNVDFDNLTEGQKVKIKFEKPQINVVTVLEKVKTVSIPYKTVYKTDRSAAVGSSNVEQEGTDGSEEVSLRMVRVNGEEIDRQRVDSNVLVAAVDKVVVKGAAPSTASRSSSSKQYSVSASVGGMSWPTTARRVSSYYGGRSRGYHTGVDIDGNTGDPVWAAKAGTVASAGWAGGYGYCVIVDHGGGVKTRYAHMSSISVKSGQSVSAGTGVGKVGSTGNSTGSHLHFEVIVNGNTVNPLSYIR